MASTSTGARLMNLSRSGGSERRRQSGQDDGRDVERRQGESQVRRRLQLLERLQRCLEVTVSQCEGCECIAPRYVCLFGRCRGEQITPETLRQGVRTLDSAGSRRDGTGTRPGTARSSPGSPEVTKLTGIITHSHKRIFVWEHGRGN
jgi:hypothetical protein